MTSDHPTEQSGFTLLEVLVALAILSVSLGVVLSAFSDGMTRIRQSEAQAIADAHAQSLPASAGVSQPLQDGTTRGDFRDGFRWQLTAAPYGTSADTDAWGMHARQVTVVVTWQVGDGERRVTLRTLRLQPKEAAP